MRPHDFEHFTVWFIEKDFNSDAFSFASLTANTRERNVDLFPLCPSGSNQCASRLNDIFLMYYSISVIFCVFFIFIYLSKINCDLERTWGIVKVTFFLIDPVLQTYRFCSKIKKESLGLRLLRSLFLLKGNEKMRTFCVFR